jgi:hypothetical protein
MKLIIFGGRNFTDHELAYNEVCLFTNANTSEFDEIEVVSGCCDRGIHTFTREDGTKVYGADGVGERIALWNGWKVKAFPADWKAHGRSAGPIRNSAMAKYGTHAIGFHDGESAGTADMIKKVKDMHHKIINY